MNTLSRFLLMCSGSNVSTLKRSPSDINKHVGLGGTILFTGLLAALSGGYALYTVFENYWAAIGFAIVWGLMIFNLDRYIVMSMKKKGGGLKQFATALPRIILAALIAVVIALPLELRIFKKEIAKELAVIQTADLKQSKAGVDSLFMKEETDLLASISGYNAELAAKDEVYNQRQLEFDYERLGTESDRTSGNAGYGPLAKEKKRQMEEADVERKAAAMRIQPKVDSIERQLALLLLKKDSAFKENSSAVKGYNGIAAQIHALNNLKKKEPVIGWAVLFITLLILALETSPIFVKLISPRGPYDDNTDGHEHAIEIHNRSNIAQREHEFEKGEIYRDWDLRDFERHLEEKGLEDRKVRRM